MSEILIPLMKKIYRLALTLTVAGAVGLYSLAMIFGPRPQSSSLVLSQKLLAEHEQLLKTQSCKTFTDPRGILHLKAEKHFTLLACLGYQHGRHRAAQMDFFRKAVEGRRAEFFGKEFVRVDFVMRLLGLSERATRAFELLAAHDPESAARLAAYSVGVNRGISEAKNAPEFEELGYLPETWEPQHTIAVLMLQSFTQTQRTFRIEADPQDESELFSPEGIEWNVPILKKGEYIEAESPPSTLKPKKRKNVSSSRPLEELDSGSLATGSNNWVISPAKSETKRAWLANDPHLDLEFPPFWFWAHLELEDGSLNAMGATLPGVPVIVSGSNTHVAWGLTNSYIDVADIVSVPRNELASTQSTRPWIWVRIAGFKFPLFFKTFERTGEGYPILPIDAPAGRALALRWTGFELEAQEWVSAFNLMTVRNAAEMDRALSQVAVPSWNYVFADTQGAIGYRAVGKIPRRTQPHPLGYHEGHPADLKYTEFLTTEEMPHVLEPPRGYVVSANNRQWVDPAFYNLGHAQHMGFRAYRIESLLFARAKHTLESLRKIQCDTRVIDAEFFNDPIVSILERDEDIRTKYAFAIDALRQWDYETGPECVACGIYRRSLDRILEETSTNEYALYRILRSDLKDKYAQEIQAGFKQALQDLGVKPNQPQSLRKWEHLHRAFFRHFSHLAQFDARDSIFTPGDDRTVNLGDSSWDPKSGIFEHQSGASQRLIVELTSPPKVYFRLAGPNTWDERTRDLNEPAWKNWADCTLDLQAFPLDWSQVTPQALEW